MNCTACQQEIPADAAFCPECGAPAPARASSLTADRTPARSRTFSGLETVPLDKSSRAAATPVLEPGKLFADRYLIDRKLGEGGMGVVYVATDKNTNEQIVLKLIHPGLVASADAMKRLVAEGVTARQIRHPDIVAVYDVGQVDGQPYLTMEYVKGGTLRTWMVNAIGRGQETGLNTAVAIVKSILAGLGEAHRMGFVHRDLKPENILLQGDPAQGDFQLKILDFGIAKAIGSPSTKSGGGSLGTPFYMAPEQNTAPDTVGPPADLYSLSVILYELLMEAVPQGRWESPSEHRVDIPKALDKVIERGLMTRARSRFQTAKEYQAALDAALQTEPAPTPPPEPDDKDDQRRPPPPPPPPPPPKNRNKLLIIGGSIAALIFVGVLANVMEQQNATRRSPGPAPGPAPITTPTTIPSPPPNQARQPWLASGTWCDDFRNAYRVNHNGTKFSANGYFAGFPVVFGGNLNPNQFDFEIKNTATGLTGYAEGRVEPDGRHVSYRMTNPSIIFGSGRFHINHAPGAETASTVNCQ